MKNQWGDGEENSTTGMCGHLQADGLKISTNVSNLLIV